MAYGGEGRSAVIAMWALTLVTLAFVMLRTYTRIMVVHSYGIDDHVYNLAFVSEPQLCIAPSVVVNLTSLLWSTVLSSLLRGFHDRIRTLRLRPEHARHCESRRCGLGCAV
jgi:hypothetical protein